MLFVCSSLLARQPRQADCRGHQEPRARFGNGLDLIEPALDKPAGRTGIAPLKPLPNIEGLVSFEGRIARGRRVLPASSWPSWTSTSGTIPHRRMSGLVFEALRCRDASAGVRAGTSASGSD